MVSDSPTSGPSLLPLGTSKGYLLPTMAPLFLVLIVFFAYWNSLSGGFVYDDVFLIVENPQIRDAASLPEIFTSGFWESSSRPSSTYYRPLVTASYLFNFSLGGLAPVGYHLANVLLHCLNVLLVFALARRLTASLPVAFVTAGIFGLHPINTEAVAWISGRTDVLAAVFMLLAINVHVMTAAKESGGRKLAWIGWGAFAMSLLAKEIAVTSVLVIAIYSLLFGKRSRLIREFLPYLSILGVYLFWRWQVLGGLGSGATEYVFNFLIQESTWVRILTTFKILGLYLFRLVWPWPLSVDYSFNQISAVSSPLDPGFLVPLVALILLIGAFAATLRRRPVVAFGIAWFLSIGSLIFLNGLFPYGVLFAERLVYLPGLGLALAATSVLARATLEKPIPRVLPFATAAAVVLTAFVWSTVDRNRDWADNLALFSSAVRVSPLSTVSHGNLATELFRLGRYDEAGDHFRQAIAIFPGYAQGHRGLGYVALAKNDPITALDHFRECAILAPDDEETHIAFATALMRLERFEEAREALEYALTLNPRTAKTYHNLGFIASRIGDTNGAIRYYERALTIDPTAPQILLNLGISYESQGRMQEANEMFERFLATPPGRFEKQKAAVRRRMSGG